MPSRIQKGYFIRFIILTLFFVISFASKHTILLVQLQSELDMNDSNKTNTLTVDELFDDTDFIDKLTISPNKIQYYDYTKEFIITVPSLTVFDHIIFVAATPRGTVAQWRRSKMDTIRKILSLNESFSQMVVIVATTAEDPISIDKNIATVITRCKKWEKQKCKSRFRTYFKLSPVLDASGSVDIHTKCVQWGCDVHIGDYEALFSGSRRIQIAARPPRQTQINALKNDPFNANSNNASVPSCDVAKTARQEHHHRTYHKDLFQSLRIYNNMHKDDAIFAHLPEHMRGYFHYLTPEPGFAVSTYTEKSALIANKWGQYTNPATGVDSTLKLVLPFVDPINKTTKPMLATVLVCQSPAQKEPVVVFLLLTPHRELNIFATHMGGFIDFCTYVNGGKRPRWSLTFSDCYPFWKPMSLKLNGLAGDKYLYLKWLANEQEDKKEDKDDNIMEIINAMGPIDSLFGQCKGHVGTDIEKHFLYQDETLKDDKELQLNLNKLAKSLIAEVIPKQPHIDIMYNCWFWNVMTGCNEFSLNEPTDVTQYCINWRELLGRGDFDDGEQYTLKFEYNEIMDAHFAKLFDKYEIVLYLHDEIPQLSLPQFFIEQTISIEPNDNLNSVPNPFKHPKSRRYLNNFHYKLTPLRNKNTIGDTEVLTDQITEGVINVLKNHNPHGDNSVKRGDSFLFEFVEIQDDLYGRMLLECKIKRTKNKEKQIKDEVNKIKLDKEEKELHAQFEKYVSQCQGVYKRSTIVLDFDKYKEDLAALHPPQLINVNLTLTKITFLNTKNNLPKNAVWRDEISKFLHYRINEQREQHDVEMEDMNE